jgi:hypothetical protein
MKGRKRKFYMKSRVVICYVTKETFGVRAGQCTSGVGSKSNIANPYSKPHEVMKQEPGGDNVRGKRAKNPCQ